VSTTAYKAAILFSRFLLRETLPTQSGLRFVSTPVMGNEPRTTGSVIGAGSDAEGVECQNAHP
jgi:hypothetical protein